MSSPKATAVLEALTDLKIDDAVKVRTGANYIGPSFLRDHTEPGGLRAVIVNISMPEPALKLVYQHQGFSHYAWFYTEDVCLDEG